MKFDQKPDPGFFSIILLMAIAIVMIAGCTESAQVQQSQGIPAGEKQSENTVARTIVTTKTVNAMEQLKTVQSLLAPVSSTGVITIDPIGDKNSGDHFTVTGTTSLPAGNEVLWQILPDTGTPPTGIDGDSRMAVGGNNMVAKGDSSVNRISIAVDLDRLIPGKYVAIVGKPKRDQSQSPPFEIGSDYGYTYFTLKQAV
jgi:hypothetical protein